MSRLSRRSRTGSGSCPSKHFSNVYRIQAWSRQRNHNAFTDKPGEKIKSRKCNLNLMNPPVMVTNQFEDKFDYLNLKMKRLIPTRSIFNFLKAKPIETNAPESSAI
jgi:hypothetical protein